MTLPRQCSVLAVWCWCLLARFTLVNTENNVERCVILGNGDLPTHFVPLPVNITTKPLTLDWRLDFTVHNEEEEEAPLVCVSIEVKVPDIRLSLFIGKCEGDVVDSHLWNSQQMEIRDLSTVLVTLNNSVISLQLGNNKPKSLASRSVTLPSHTLLRVSHKRSIDLAVGCPIKCPAVLGSRASGNRLSTVKKLKKRSENFFFKPGREFARLNFEMKCETPLGNEVFLGDTTITRDQIEERSILSMWHNMSLLYNDEQNIFEIFINYRPAKTISNGLQICNIFRNFIVRAEGETFFSFTCDPTSGESQLTASSIVQDLTVNSLDVVKVVLVAIIVTLLIIVPTIYFLLRCAGFKFETSYHPENRSKLIRQIFCKKGKTGHEPQRDMEERHQLQV
ncbi:hypothetical protein Hamer_G002126 [Homarus americanus]|uniref:ZP domain-containing protein n=1 Tax=Homarus americanus TaxID=6706 RepID=A0A8J5JXQ0_HOMAM|nr:hypothetical protein Hamer_G002126 [Homarus americanus]